MANSIGSGYRSPFERNELIDAKFYLPPLELTDIEGKKFWVFSHYMLDGKLHVNVSRKPVKLSSAFNTGMTEDLLETLFNVMKERVASGCLIVEEELRKYFRDALWEAAAIYLDDDMEVQHVEELFWKEKAKTRYFLMFLRLYLLKIDFGGYEGNFKRLDGYFTLDD